MILFSNEEIEIRLDQGLSLLKIRIKAQKLSEQAANMLVDTFLEVTAKRIMLDFSKINDVEQEALDVFTAELLKNLKQTGARKIAVVLDNEQLKVLFETLENKYDVKKLKWLLETDRARAEAWLKER